MFTSQQIDAYCAEAQLAYPMLDACEATLQFALHEARQACGMVECIDKSTLKRRENRDRLHDDGNP